MVRLPWRRNSSNDDETGEDSEDGHATDESETDVGDDATDDRFDGSGKNETDDSDVTGDEEESGAVTEDASASAETDEFGKPTDEEALVTCRCQDGTLSVYEDAVHIERASGSKFSDKWIAMNQIRGVNYTERLMIHFIQIEQTDFENDEESILSTPIDENTLHLGHGKRDCVKRARDAILERATGS